MKPAIRTSSLRGLFPLHNRGFALLITIVLLAFLVLLLVGLSGLTRVETQVTGNSQLLTQARQNALLALNIAIGQLQKTAGPDQRVTATADLAGNDTGGVLADGASPSTIVGSQKYWDSTSTSNGLSSLQPGTRYWTGVWGNADPSTPTAGNGNIYEKAPRPVLLDWLVSGNEPATSTVAAAGNITASNGGSGTIAPSYTPASTTAGLSSITDTSSMLAAMASNSITVGGQSAVLLVGPNSTGTAIQPTTSQTAVDRYVAAPLVPIQNSSVPGLSGSQTIGRYAWWVGDNGVKARVNLTDPYADQTNASTQPEARYRLMTAPRSGVEVISDFASSSYASHTQSSTLSNNTAGNALNLSQAELIDTTASGLTAAELEPRFHDFTTSSTGLEADSYNGGLRRDLTYYLEQSALPTWTGTNGESAGASEGLIPTAYSPTMASLSGDTRIPRWDVLYSFYNLPSATGDTLTGSTSDVVQMRPSTATQMGITPVVVQMRLMVGYEAQSTSPYFSLLANPLVVLANPYPVTLNAPNGLDFHFHLDERLSTNTYFNIGISGQPARTWPLYQGASSLLGSTTVFHIPAFQLAPGQAKYYSLTNNQNWTGSPSNKIPLNEGVNATLNYVIQPADAKNNSYVGATISVYENDKNSTFLTEFTDPSSGALIQQIGGINPDRGSNYYNSATATANEYQSLLVYDWVYNAPAMQPITSLYTNGVASSSLRAYADFNPRAGYYRVTNEVFSAAPYTQAFMQTSADSGFEDQAFTSGLATVAWGRDWNNPQVTNSQPITTAIFFDLPRRSATDELPVQSLGALQHANLDAEDIPSTTSLATEFGDSTLTPPPNPGHQPAYAFGNSYANIFVPRASSTISRTDTFISNSGTTTTARNYYDISYLLNSSLWDGYFFSTISQASGSTSGPVSPRLALRGDTGLSTSALASAARSGTQAAAYTVINGSFNINSTSVDAWAAVLGGMKNLPNIPGLGNSGSNTSVVFPRSLHQTTAALATPTGTGADSYSGFRQLSSTQIQTLASAIVQQIRMRGPFISLGQFVNRVLVSATNSTEQSKGLGQAGALQTAIDGTGLNSPLFSDPSASAANDKAIIPTTNENATYGNGGGSAEAVGRGTNSIYADTNTSTSVAYSGIPTQLQRSTAIPGWLTQADVLQAIGPILSARSDTFTIRAYGDVINPAKSSTAPVARVWCEAVVQRIPDYVDTTSTPNPWASPSGTINVSFGRKFKIVSFRWLTPDDI